MNNQYKQSPWLFLVIDGIMLLLIVLNLTWLIFDTLFQSLSIQDFLYWLIPSFTTFYSDRVHQDFQFYDLIFVSIFLVEFSLRWVAAIYQKTYHRWFFYPFIHWYDLIGCIPVGSFRWLRLLRIISILYRLQSYGLIDLSKTYPWKFVAKYFNIGMEEVSDRVVVKVLDGIKSEIKEGSPVFNHILTDVLLPHKVVIADWLTAKINDINNDVYVKNKESLRQYVNESIANSTKTEWKVSVLDKFPVIGPAIIEEINSTVSHVVFNVLDRFITDIGTSDTDHLVSELLEAAIHNLLQPDSGLDDAIRSIIDESLEVVKSEVTVQRWKLDYQN